MKSILFHYPVLGVGGAEQSSLRMIKALADRGWEVTLVLTTGGGSLESEIDPRVNVTRLRPLALGQVFHSARGIGPRLRAFPDLIGYVGMWLLGVLRAVPFFFRRYDAAAVLLTGTSSLFLRKVVRAKTRAIWIRNDLLRADPTGRAAANLRSAVEEIDYFICVSETSRRSLLSTVPQSRGKDVVVYNILDSDAMRRKAFESSSPFQPLAECVSVLSVCRLNDHAKGLRRMARVCRTLKDLGINFHWYIAGDGPDRDMLESELERLNITDRMTLLGNIHNPFPAYIKADMVAMLSNYEGLCGVVNESRVLGKPIIATRVSGIDEQIVSGVNGLIVAQDEVEIVCGLKRMITEPALRDRLATGGYPDVLLDDSRKVDQLEELFLRRGHSK